MPGAVEAEQHLRSLRGPKTKASSSRELRQLHVLYNKIRHDYLDSTLALSITRLLEAKSRPPVTRILSLGLGSLKSSDRNRRIKQLTTLIAIAEHLRQDQSSLEIYAQDPSFSATDEAFLQTLGVQILRTSSATELGQAAQYINESTLIYCPFLTLEAYQLLFSTEKVNFFIGDDFNALRNKWPKHTTERNEAESLLRQHVQEFRKRVIANDEKFWDADDKPFPMAMYWKVTP